MTLPHISRKRSRVHGFGVFAREAINKNRRIIDYAGELVRNDQSEAREERYLAKGCIWVFRVNRRPRRIVLSGTPGLSRRGRRERSHACARNQRAGS